jgi:hypothetical protein
VLNNSIIPVRTMFVCIFQKSGTKWITIPQLTLLVVISDSCPAPAPGILYRIKL